MSEPGGSDPQLVEIERKFRLRRVPDLAEGARSVAIEQGYVAIDEETEVRVRRAGESRVITIKGGHGEVRDEVEIAIDEGQFAALWPLTAGRRLSKRRLIFSLGEDLEVELDVFEGELEGLLIAELEFESEAESQEFEAPKWLDGEVTGDDRYSGQSLATEGAPSRSYRLRGREKPAEGIVRIAAGRAEKALEELRGASEDGDFAGAVHSARKDLKKLRSVVRLVRAEIGEKRFRAENERYRDAGRRLSASRDAEVRLETLAALRRRCGDELPEAPVDDWSELLSRERQDPSGDDALAAQIESAMDEIERGRDEISRWRLPAESWALLAPGIERGYKRGRREMNRARDQRRAEDVHSWRKRVKDLWYQLRIVREMWPALVGETADQAHELADLLGDHHDLTVLHEDLEAREGLSGRKALATAIERRQGELLDEAFRLGDRIYAEKPKAFLGRLSVYWEAWRED